jgi:Holliday junction DNA helicase RuvB
MPDPVAPNHPPPNPPTLNHVIGQKQVVDRLKVALDASFADDQPFPHTLFLGPPGLGKTSLSKLVAKELAAEFWEALGQTLATPSVLSGFLLRPTTDKAVLFLDEAHLLPVACQTALYRAMEEGVVFVPQPYTNAITKMQTVRFTLMSATTDPQLLLPPLRDRFRLVCQMQPYSSDEIAAILRQRVRQLSWQVDEACFEAIAVRSFGTPRIAIRLLESAYRTARSEGGVVVDYGHLLRTLALEQLDGYGLGSDEQKYLLLLSEASAPVRVGVLAGKMRTTHLVLSQVIEERLLYLDLIERLPQGRILTGKGMEHARKLKQEANRA